MGTQLPVCSRISGSLRTHLHARSYMFKRMSLKGGRRVETGKKCNEGVGEKVESIVLEAAVKQVQINYKGVRRYSVMRYRK